MHVHYGLDAQLLPEVGDHTIIVCQVGCIVDIRGSLPCFPDEEQPVHVHMLVSSTWISRRQECHLLLSESNVAM